MSREPTAEEIAAARAIARRDYDGEDLWDSFTSGRQADLIEVARAALEAAAALSASPPEDGDADPFQSDHDAAFVARALADLDVDYREIADRLRAAGATLAARPKADGERIGAVVASIEDGMPVVHLGWPLADCGQCGNERVVYQGPDADEIPCPNCSAPAPAGETLRRKVERSHANFRRSYELYRDPKEQGYALALEWVLRAMDEIADDQGLTVRSQEGGKA